MGTDRIRRVCSGLVTLFLFLPGWVSAAQYTAYSMKVAQARIEKAGDDWREQKKAA